MSFILIAWWKYGHCAVKLNFLGGLRKAAWYFIEWTANFQSSLLL
jgi:hypothetical protein